MKEKISRMMLNRYLHSEFVLPEYNPRADFQWIQSSSNLPWLELKINIPWQTILQEINSLPISLVSHRDSDNEHLGWKSGCLHGRSFSETREDENYDNLVKHDWTPEALKYLPNTVKYFRMHWPADQYRRLRIMLLEPNGYIGIHNDGHNKKLSAINIAISQPDECYFVMEKHGCVPFKPGTAFWLNVSNNHTVFNQSKDPRWHIIVHQNFDNKKMQDIALKSYHHLYNKTICIKQD